MDGRQLAALAVAAVVGLVPVPAAGQSADSVAAPQTSWGDPDLQRIPDRRRSGCVQKTNHRRA